jgi:hypothetical protein
MPAPHRGWRLRRCGRCGQQHPERQCPESYSHVALPCSVCGPLVPLSVALLAGRQPRDSPTPFGSIRRCAVIASLGAEGRKPTRCHAHPFQAIRAETPFRHPLEWCEREQRNMRQDRHAGAFNWIDEGQFQGCKWTQHASLWPGFTDDCRFAKNGVTISPPPSIGRKHPLRGAGRHSENSCRRRLRVAVCSD